MNSTAITVLAEAGIEGKDAEILLRSVLSDLVSPSHTAKEAIAGLGLEPADVDPSTIGITRIVRRLADAGFDEAAARTIFGERGAPAILALVRRVERMEEIQGS